VSEYWGSEHETSNFVQGYMCQSTGGVCTRQVTLYRFTFVRVLGGVCMRQVTLYRLICVRVLGDCVGEE